MPTDGFEHTPIYLARLNHFGVSMDIFPMVSLLAEVFVIILAAVIAMNKKKNYGWMFAVSYALFLVYDVVGFLEIAMDQNISEFILLVGVVFSLVGIWQLYQEK